MRQTQRSSFQRHTIRTSMASDVDKDLVVGDAANGNQKLPTNQPDDAEFGQVVPLKRASSNNDSPLFSVGEPATVSTSSNPSAASTAIDEKQLLKERRNRNIVAAVLSISLAILQYVWQLTHPITPIQLLTNMQSTSQPATVIGKNAKPTVVDFWAPWCENCKLLAPTLQQVEQEYGDRVNFVMINGDQNEAWPYIEAFGVDAIPHLALVSAQGDVETALIGPIPKHVLEADLDVLLEDAAASQAAPSVQTTTASTAPGSVNIASGESLTSVSEQQLEASQSGSVDRPRKIQLPYTMLDVFASRPEQRRVHFD